MTRSCNITERLHGQRGNVLVWFALLLPVLFGFMALSVDLARLYLTKVELQNAADAAALAGAYKYAQTTSLPAAIAEAKDMATSNLANGSPIPLSSVTPADKTVTGYTYGIQVTIALSGMNLIFAPVLGMTTSDVQATAIAAANAVVHPAVPTPILVQ